MTADGARIGLIQMRCEKASFSQNLKEIERQISEAALRHIDIIAFPEMCLTGYCDPIKFPNAAVRIEGPEVASFLRATSEFPGTVIAGVIEANHQDKPFITQLVARNGALLGFYRKLTIENQEAEWFSEGSAVPIFQHDDLAFGVAVCADLTNPLVFERLRYQGAQMVFEVAAPGLDGDQESRDWEAGYRWWSAECERHLSQRAKDNGLWIPVATQAGRTLDEDFPGGAFVFDSNGNRLFATTDGSAGPIFLQIELGTRKVHRLP